MVEYVEGILKIANLFLSVVAGFIAISLLNSSRKKEFLKPWYVLIISLVLFAVQEVLGALRAFQIYSNLYITHIIPTVMLGLLIWALVMQVNTK